MSEAKVSLSAEDKTRAAFASMQSGLKGLTTSAASVTGALGALGVAGAALTFAASIKGAIDAADQINKLSQRTGVAAEQLSQLQFAAKLSDVSTESLTSGIKKLNLSIAEGLAGDKAKIEMFRNLGISLTDASGKAKSADKVLLEMAGTFSTANDGAVKTAYAVGLMGKAGDEMIPLLNGGTAAIAEMMGKAEKLGLTISTDFAQQAEAFNDNLSLFEASTKTLSIAIAGDLVTSLGKATKAMADTAVEGGKLKAIWAGLLTLFTGDERHKNNVALVQDTELMLSLEKGLGKLRAAGYTDDTLAVKSQLKQLDEVNARLKITTKNRAALNEVEAKADAAKPVQTKPLKPLTGGTVPAATTSEYDNLIKRIKERISLTNEEIAKGRELTEEEKFAAKVLADVATAKKALTEPQKVIINGLIAESARLNDSNEKRAKRLRMMQAEAAYIMEVEEDIAAALTADSQARDRVSLAITSEIDAMADANELLNAEGKLIRATDKERQIALEHLRIEQKLRRDIWELDHNGAFDESQREIERDRLNTLAATAKGMATQRANLDEFQRVWGSIDQTAHDVFVNIFEGGSNVFKKLGQTLKASVLDLLYQMTIKKWIFQIAGNVSGTAGDASGGGGVGGLLNMASNANSAYNFASGNSFASNLGNAAAIKYAGLTNGGSFASSVGGGLATDAMGATVIEGAAGATLGSGAAMALQALPYIGLAVAAIMLMSKKGGGPKQDGQSGVYGSLTDTLGGQITAGKKNQLGGVLDPVVTGLQTQYNSLAKLFGGEAAVQFGLAISRDPKGDSPTFLESYAQKDGKDLFRNINLNVGRSEEDLAQAFTAATVDSLIGALKASKLSPQFAAFFDTIAGDASTEIKQAALTTATNVTTLTKAMAWLGEDFSGLSVKARDNMINLAGGLDALISASQSFRQNFYTEAENQDATWRQLVKEFNTLGVVLPSTNEGFRKLVEGLDKESPLYMAVLALSPAFAKLYPLIEKTGEAATAAADTAVLTNALLDKVDSTKSELLAGYNAEASALKQTIDQHRAYAKSLREFRDDLLLGEDSILDLAGRTGLAASRYDQTAAKAQAGDLEAIAALQGDSAAYLEALKNSSPTKLEFNIGFARVAAGLTLTAAKADSAATIAQRELDVMTGQLSALGLLKDVTQQGFAALLAAYTSAKGAAGAAGAVRLDGSLANGLTTASGATLDAGWLGDTLGYFTQQNTLNDLYMSTFGRVGDSEGLAYHTAQLNAGVTYDQLAAQFAQAKLDGSHAGGLDFVPFSGYRAELHYGERVKTAAASRNEDAMAAEIKAMRVEMKAVLESIADHTYFTSKNTQEMKDRGVPVLNSPDGEVLEVAV